MTVSKLSALHPEAFSPEHWPQLFTDALNNGVDVRDWQAAGDTSIDNVLTAYRNNTHEGRIRALQVTFPVAEQLLGETAFAAYASDYVQKYPARSADLDVFGDDFDVFLAARDELYEVPYIAEMAAFEWRVQAARFAQLETALSAELLASFDEAQLESLKVRKVASLQSMRCQYNVHELWWWHKHPETEFQLYKGDYNLVVNMQFAAQQGWHIAAADITSGELQLLMQNESCLLTAIIEGFAAQQADISDTLNNWLQQQWLVADD